MMSNELDQHVKVLDQMRDLHAVLEPLPFFKTASLHQRLSSGLPGNCLRDSARQNIKLFEVRFSPDWAFHGHNLDWDEALEGSYTPGSAPNASSIWRLA